MSNILRRGRLLLVASATLAAVLTGTAAMAQDPERAPGEDLPTFKPRQSETIPGEIIVKFKENAAPGAVAEARRAEGLEKKKDLELIGAELSKVEGQSAEAAVRALKRRPDVEYATPNRKVYPSGYADEPRFSELWGLNNTGQADSGGTPGTPNLDVNGKEASAITQGSTSLKVAVIDDGVDFSHPDLAGRKWVNPGESGSGKETNGIDDDANGYKDDVNGWDVCHQDKSVHDPGDDAHGTHVAGTIAASVNGEGVVGVAPNVKVMALKFLSETGTGSGCNSLAGAVEAIGYAKKMGAKISNNSWGYYGPPDPAEKAAIDASGQLFVAAAGNDGANNDALNPANYPASYSSPNILSVAAINNQGNLADFSAFGVKTVDISAPGVNILSSIPGSGGANNEPAAALSSVGSSGKALVAGYGADEIGDSAKRASFFAKSFSAVGRGTQPVVLVDDDGSSGWYPDVGPALASAIQSATGSAPTVIDVADGANGPDLSQLSGKTVVWATGQDYGYGDDVALNSTDQTTLTNFLNGGGKLVINGMDAMLSIESSPFVTGTLGLQVTSDVGVSTDATTFSGSSGTAFAGESYAFNGDTAYAPYHDKIAAGTAQGIYGSGSGSAASYESWNGTLMATPHVTGVAALLASKYPALLNKPTELKTVVMAHGKPVSATAGKTVTGKMADANAVVSKPTVTFPTPVTSTKDRTPTIAATVKDFQTNLTKANMTISVDGVSRTGSAVYTDTSDRLSYTPTTNMALGTHSVKVTAKDANGNTVSRSWTFKIVT
ncbi:MAG: S8 family serine peptidase [Actinomycetota bacterium]|nr:S8 family serine peptidase [Actinomycetota bacterium]